jgi:hypothetical protein
MLMKRPDRARQSKDAIVMQDIDMHPTKYCWAWTENLSITPMKRDYWQS